MRWGPRQLSSAASCVAVARLGGGKPPEEAALPAAVLQAVAPPPADPILLPTAPRGHTALITLNDTDSYCGHQHSKMHNQHGD